MKKAGFIAVFIYIYIIVYFLCLCQLYLCIFGRNAKNRCGMHLFFDTFVGLLVPNLLPQAFDFQPASESNEIHGDTGTQREIVEYKKRIAQ